MSRENLPSSITKDQIPKDTVHARLESLQEELKKNPKNIEIRSQIASLKRELNRYQQFTNVKKTDSEKIIGDKNFDKLNANDLLRIDREEGLRGNFLSKTFLYKQLKSEDGTTYEESTDGRNLNEGDTLLVDFGKNESANRRIGLGHMLGVDVGYVKIDGKIGVRSIVNGRVGYYIKNSPDGYLAVFTGTLVTIPSASEIGDFEKNSKTGLQRNTDQKESEKAIDLHIERLERSPETSIVEVSTLMRESYDFWKSKGFSEEQIAGLLGNEYQESKCNPRSIGDGGKAHGIFQWHPDRRVKIQQATGIDITTSSHYQQLEAAWWEMTEESYEKKVFPLLKNAKTPAEAAGIISLEYLRPKDQSGEPKIRGRYAENIFNQFRFINNPELANLPEGEANTRIISYALDAQKRGDILGAEHCTDWVDKIYLQTTGKTVYRNSLYNGVASSKIGIGTGLHGTHATLDQLSVIQPGNHIMVDHMEDGQFNQGRTHSVIALSRPINGIVEVVSYPNNKMPPRIEKYDLLGEGRAKNGKVLRIQAA